VTRRGTAVNQRFSKEINDHINCVGCKGKGRPTTGHKDPQSE